MIKIHENIHAKNMKEYPLTHHMTSKKQVEYGHPNECNEVPTKNLKRKKNDYPQSSKQ